jgi:hydrogenase maturation protease
MNRAMVLVVGYGNTLRQDDGYGPVVVDRLRERISDGRVRVLTRQQLSSDLAADLERVGFCVLIDAATTGVRGELTIREVQPEPTEIGSLGHELSAGALLGLTQQLLGRAPRCVICSTLPESMELGEGLTATVTALVEPAVAAIARLIDDYLADADAGAGAAD